MELLSETQRGRRRRQISHNCICLTLPTLFDSFAFVILFSREIMGREQGQDGAASRPSLRIILIQ